MGAVRVRTSELGFSAQTKSLPGSGSKFFGGWRKLWALYDNLLIKAPIRTQATVLSLIWYTLFASWSLVSFCTHRLD